MVLQHHLTFLSPSNPFLCSCPSLRYLLLSRGSSALVLLDSPPVTIPLPVATAAISSVATAAASPGTYRSIASHGAWPHKTRGEPQYLTHWHWSNATPSPPSLWAVVWGKGEEVAVLLLGQNPCSGGLVLSMGINPTSRGSPKPTWATKANVWLKHLLRGRDEGAV